MVIIGQGGISRELPPWYFPYIYKPTDVHTRTCTCTWCVSTWCTWVLDWWKCKVLVLVLDYEYLKYLSTWPIVLDPNPAAQTSILQKNSVNLWLTYCRPRCNYIGSAASAIFSYGIKRTAAKIRYYESQNGVPVPIEWCSHSMDKHPVGNKACCSHAICGSTTSS